MVEVELADLVVRLEPVLPVYLLSVLRVHLLLDALMVVLLLFLVDFDLLGKLCKRINNFSVRHYVSLVQKLLLASV